MQHTYPLDTHSCYISETPTTVLLYRRKRVYYNVLHLNEPHTSWMSKHARVRTCGCRNAKRSTFCQCGSSFKHILTVWLKIHTDKQTHICIDIHNIHSQTDTTTARHTEAGTTSSLITIQTFLNSDLSNTGTLNATERHRHAQIHRQTKRDRESRETH